MIRTIRDFEHLWSREIESTQKILKHIPDRALGQQIDPQGRTLARLAWHITTNISDLAISSGLTIAGPTRKDPVPATSREIFTAYSDAAISLLEQVKKQWTDAMLEEKIPMFGEEWARGFALMALVHHQIHHRAQMTVLMRQAGLEVPGVFGPARQDWAAFGKKPPAV
jgi:uncharacterized damage-inducible protein DinB